MIRCEADHFAFFRRSYLNKVIYLLYVDDNVITGDDQATFMQPFLDQS